LFTGFYSGGNPQQIPLQFPLYESGKDLPFVREQDPWKTLRL